MAARSGPTPEPSREQFLAALHDRLVERVRSDDGKGCLVELACGSGPLTLLLAAARPDLQIIGLDPSTDRLRKATEAATHMAVTDRVRFERADFSVLPLSDGTASIVVGAGVFGAAVNPRAVAAEVHRVLAPGGVAVLVEDVAEAGNAAHRGTLLPSLSRPGRDEDAVRDVIARSPFRADAAFTRLPVGGDDSFLEITLKRPVPPPREPTSWRLS